MWRDGRQGYGLIGILFHWVVALTVAGLFALGLWMVNLGYFSPWYYRAPAIHQSVGLLLMAVVVLRFVWRRFAPRPEPLPGHRAWERRSGRWVHAALSLLTVAVIAAGYLISTAGGEPVSVFGWFEVPAILEPFTHQEDIAGDWHRWLAWALIVLAALHALAALKHHFVDRDRTLVRILAPGRTKSG